MSSPGSSDNNNNRKRPHTTPTKRPSLKKKTTIETNSTPKDDKNHAAVRPSYLKNTPSKFSPGQIKIKEETLAKQPKPWVTFYFVNCASVLLRGFVVTFEGYARNLVADNFCAKIRSNAMQNFLEMINPVNFLYTNLYQNGQRLQSEFEGDKKFNQKGFIVLPNTTDKLNLPWFQKFFDDSLLPLTKNLGQLYTQMIPVFLPNKSIVELSTWSDILSINDILDMISKEFHVNAVDPGKSFTDIRQFFHSDKQLIYSCWKEGHVPPEISKKFEFTENLLEDSDLANYASAYPDLFQDDEHDTENLDNNHDPNTHDNNSTSAEPNTTATE